MIRQGRLFHDMTLDYLRPTEPKSGSKVYLYFRCGKKEADKIFVIWESSEETREIVMRKHETEDQFDYYQTSVRIPKSGGIIYYYFRIESGDERVYYDRTGATYNVPTENRFRLIPDFSTPEWAKGAIMYQIFVDRFRNGDPSNDVLTNEYYYVNGKSVREDNWRKDPDPYGADIRTFHGGDLQGVIDKLGYLKGLGVEVIYLNPIFVSPSNHKYDTQDYDHIDPHYGRIVFDVGELLTDSNDNRNATRYINRVTNLRNLEASDALFAKLVEEAHKLGIRVILDGVFNHCGSFNKWMDKEGIYEGRAGYEEGAFVSKESPYRDYFKFSSDRWPNNEDYEGWWGFNTLPKLNYEGSSKLEEYILGIAKKWVSAPYYADGWRLDVAADVGHSEEYNHRFWRKFREAVKEANPNALILAEHYGNAMPWLMGGEWDTVMNYDGFMDPVSNFFTGMEKHSDEFHEELIGNVGAFWQSMQKAGIEAFSENSYFTAMNELSNHDHSRFLTRTNGVVGRSSNRGCRAADEGISKAVMRQAVILQMTWPGAPTIYYGDEAGVCGFTDPDNRRTYPWGLEDVELIDFHKKMINIRRSSTELKTGSLVKLDAGDNVLAFGRFNRTCATMVVINRSEYETVCEIDVEPLGIPSEAKLLKVMESTSRGFRSDPLNYNVKNGKLVRVYGPLSAVVLQYNRITAVNEEAFWSTNFFRM